MISERLKRQMEFVTEIDRVKSVLRQTLIIDGSRRENDAEHSWHIALMALVFWEYASSRHIDLLRVVKMLLIHDLVEIDAGDTYCYDEADLKTQKAREIKAAERIFKLLPEDQAVEFRALWDEFEEAKTPESRFGNALDRLQPLIHNIKTEGLIWQKYGIKRAQVIDRMSPIKKGAPYLWELTESIIEYAVEQGYLVVS